MTEEEREHFEGLTGDGKVSKELARKMLLQAACWCAQVTEAFGSRFEPYVYYTVLNNDPLRWCNWQLVSFCWIGGTSQELPLKTLWVDKCKVLEARDPSLVTHVAQIHTPTEIGYLTIGLDLRTLTHSCHIRVKVVNLAMAREMKEYYTGRWRYDRPFQEFYEGWATNRNDDNPFPSFLPPNHEDL